MNSRSFASHQGRLSWLLPCAFPLLFSPHPRQKTERHADPRPSWHQDDNQTRLIRTASGSPEPVCDTASFRIVYGGQANYQLLDVKSLQDDAAVSAGQTDATDQQQFDGWIQKTDKYGNLRWSFSYGEKQNDYFKKITLIGNSGLLATGSYDNTDPVQPTGFGWVLKTDINGNVAWSYRLDINPSVIQDAFQTSDGGFALAASVNVNGSEAKIIVIKISAAGSLQWMHQYSKGGSDYGYAIRQAKDGNLLVSGFEFNDQTYNHDGFLMKISEKDGTFLWAKTYGSNGDDVIDCFTEDNAGNLYLSLAWGGNQQPCLIKTDANGKVIWAKLYTTSLSSARSNSIEITDDKGFMLSLTDANTHAGGAILKLNSDGSSAWAYDYHPSGSTQYRQHGVDELSSHQGYFIAGYSNTNAGDQAYIAKTSPDGKSGACEIREVTVTTTSISPDVEDFRWTEDAQISAWKKAPVKRATQQITKTLLCPQCCVSSNTEVDTTICGDEPFTLPDGSTVTKAGTYSVKFASSSGCDSIITTHLTLRPAYRDTLRDSICLHEDYLLPDGKTVNTSGSYVTHFQSTTGCDSTITTILSYKSLITKEVYDSICPGASFLLPDGTSVSKAGDYHASLPSATGCDTSAVFHLKIASPPSFNLGNDTCIIPGKTLLLSSPGSFSHYEWQDGSGQPTLKTSSPGIYWLKASNACGVAVDSITITDDCLPTILIPSAFSPNGDGMNDVFRLLNVRGEKLILFCVFDRWGKRVFYTTDIAKGWNGTWHGSKEPMATYVYLVKLLDPDGQPKTYKGSVVLIR